MPRSNGSLLLAAVARMNSSDAPVRVGIPAPVAPSVGHAVHLRPAWAVLEPA